MRENIYYINHNGEKLDMSRGGIIVDANDLRDYSWDYYATNNIISSFTKGIKEKTLPVLILAPTKKQFLALRNNAFKVFERDVVAQEYGKIYCGEYYLKCFVTGSATEDYYKSPVASTPSFTILTDDPTWYKDTIYDYFVIDDTDTGLDFPTDFEFDYAGASSVSEIINTAVQDAAFKLTIYGACQDPYIKIDEHTYRVNTTVDAGEYLVVDTSEKSIYKYSSFGVKTNCLKDRDRSEYVFQSIAEGKHIISWPGTFKFSITLMERRSEPEWI